MRSIAIIGGLAACASAQLLPNTVFNSLQSLPLEGPTKGTNGESNPYNANAVFQSTYNTVFSSGTTHAKRNPFEKRHVDGDCSPQPLGAGPSITPDTPAAFVSSPILAAAANGAATPAGYTNTFKNLNASSTTPMGYLGYDSISAYDPSICSAKCNSLAGCTAFDIYFERDPTIDPGANCTNPPSTTLIKCAYWGTTLTAQSATNDGQYCADFQIVIAGSNGYIQTQPSYTEPGYNSTFLGTSAINAPTQCNSYIGYQLFNDGQPFDPARCIAACEATSAYNVQYLNGRAICRFIDTYIINKNGVPQGQICAMYTRSWDSSYATNTGQTDTDGNVYTFSYSYTWSNSSNPGAQICDSGCMSQSPCPGSNSTTTTTTTTTGTTTVSSTTTKSSVGPTTTVPTTTTTTTVPTTKPTTMTTTTTTTTPVTVKPTSTTTTSCTTTAKPTTTVAPTTTTTTTTTTKATTTTTTSATPTGTCFNLQPCGPSWLGSGSFLGLDTSCGQLSWHNSANSASAFKLNANGQLVLASTGQTVMRTNSQVGWWSPAWGYFSTGGQSSISCSISGTTLTCAGSYSPTSIWCSQGQPYVAHGNCPGNNWQQISLSIQWTTCPSAPSGNGNNGWNSWGNQGWGNQGWGNQGWGNSFFWW